MRINPGTTVPDDVQSSVQIANDLGEQVVNLVPIARWCGARPQERRRRARRAKPGSRQRRRRRCLGHPPAPGHPGRRSEQADRGAGDVAAGPGRQSAHPHQRRDDLLQGVRRLSAAVHRAPGQRAPALDAVTAVAPQLRQDLANTAALVQVLAQQKSGLHTLLTSGSIGLQRRGRPRHVPVGQPGLLPARHGRHPLEHRRAHQPHQPVAGPGLQPVLLRRGGEDRGPGSGQAHRRRAARTPTRRSCAPACSCRPSSTSRRSPTARRAPSRTRFPVPGASRCSATVSGPPPSPASRPPPAGQVVAPTAQEADVEVASATPVGQVVQRLVPRAGRPPGRCCSRWAGWWSRPCSWPGAPGPPAGARAAAGPERCPGTPPWRAGSSDTRRENREP